MNTLPNISLHDESIQLRALALENADEVFSLIDKNREYLKTWLTWLDRTKTIEDVISFIQGSIERSHKGTGVDMGIFVDEKLVGVIGLKDLDIHNKKVIIGYWLDEDMQGNGYMTKSVSLLIDYVFNTLYLHRIQITCAVGNEKSRAIPKRLRFTKEGITRDAEWLYDHFVDWEVYSLLSKDEQIVSS